MDNTKKWMIYAVHISAALQALFDEDSEHAIDKEELFEGDNLTEFMHALANVVPVEVCNRITGSDHNWLEFNQMANTMCVQFMMRAAEEKAE